MSYGYPYLVFQGVQGYGGVDGRFGDALDRDSFRKPWGGHAMRNRSTIRVGVLHSLSGTMAEDETPLSLVAQMTVDEINESGGILGKQVEVVLRDGASDPAIFANRARELLAEEEVETIFGCWTSSSRRAVRPAVEEHNSLLWYPPPRRLAWAMTGSRRRRRQC